MSHLLITHTATIGGRDYKMTRLNVAKARQALAIVQKLLGMYEVSEDGAVTNTVSPVFMAGISGKLTEAELSKLVELFGPTTTVDFQDGDDRRPSRVLPLSSVPAQDELWSGRLEDMLDWVDACIAFNFAGVIAKMHAAVEQATRQIAAAKAEAEASGDSQA